MDDKKKTYRTKSGKVLTDADVETLAREVERDYDVDALKARRRADRRWDQPRQMSCRCA